MKERGVGWQRSEWSEGAGPRRWGPLSPPHQRRRGGLVEPALVATEPEEQEGRGSEREGKAGRLGRSAGLGLVGVRGFCFSFAFFIFYSLSSLLFLNRN